MAGPVIHNTVFMANVPKWGTIDGNQLQEKFKMKQWLIMNDFEANSYGILLLEENDFVSLNGMKANPEETRGVIGPGTGLGCGILYCSPFKTRSRTYVLPSEGGHTDFSYFD